MKKLMYLVMTIAMSLFAADASAQYIPVTTPGNCITDGSGSVITAGTMIIVGTDANDNPIPYRAGTSVMSTTAPISRSIVNGALLTSLQLADPASTSPTNVLYRFVIQDNLSKKITVYKQIIVAINDLGTNFNFCKMNPLPFTTQIQFAAAPFSFSGDWNLLGNLTVALNTVLHGLTNTSESTPKFNRVVWLDGVTNTTLATCLAAAATAKSVCEVPPNYSETVATDITVTNDTGLHFDGVAAISMGTHQFKCAGGTCNDFFIDSDIPWGSNGSPSAGVVFTYTGTTTPFSFGDTVTSTTSLVLRNIAINVSGGGAAVSAITLNRIHPCTISNVRLIGVTGQLGINMNGTGEYTGNCEISNLSANGFTSCIKMTANGNSNHIFASCPNTAAGGKAIDITSGNGNIIFVDGENATVGISFGASSNVFGNRVYIYGQGNTTDAVFGAGSIGNTVDNIGANCTGIVPTVSDSGTSNTVWNPCKFKMDVNGNFTSNTITTATGTTSTLGGSTKLTRILSNGTAATSCAVTGAGTTATCSLVTTATDSFGVMRIASSGTSQAATGTLTLTLSSALGTFGVCSFTPSDASTAWNARVSVIQTSYSSTAPTATWDNNAVALVAANSYDVTYRCAGQ